jgi:hypothetical protein
VEKAGLQLAQMNSVMGTILGRKIIDRGHRLMHRNLINTLHITVVNCFVPSAYNFSAVYLPVIIALVISVIRVHRSFSVPTIYIRWRVSGLI